MTSNELGVAILACGLLVSGFLWIALKMTEGKFSDDEVPHE